MTETGVQLNVPISLKIALLNVMLDRSKTDITICIWNPFWLDIDEKIMFYIITII